MAGACATILKAAFDGSVPFNSLARQNDIVTASADGLSLVAYTGSDAEPNHDQRRNRQARLEHRSGARLRRVFTGARITTRGLRLGEAVALSILRDQSNNYAGENFEGFDITTFDGENMIV